MEDSKEDVPPEQEEVKDSQKKGDRKEKSKDKRPESKLDKKTQKLIADLKRCKIQMEEAKKAIQKPPVKLFTPDIFNSLSPYYNVYTVNYLLKDLENQDQSPLRQPWGQRATALGLPDPELSLKMDKIPGPVNPSRIPGTLFRSKTWAKNIVDPEKNLGSTRLPPLPMPSVPKFHHATFQPHKMTFDELQNFRTEMKNVLVEMEEKRAKKDYDRTLKDWERMNLSELKSLPPQSRYHVKKAIHSYLGTSQGSAKALRPLTKEIWDEKSDQMVK
ncbi:uncharacterized protein LOC116292138 [Actinia tenebrosa]|uniref:Uncharacterized protein LOC116292138 n=1 Tax=Actinia tenebrosa TaxID=6105 RepID=A0A6P8HHD3_ACTTE|nr:uncharacterized protein LOC116292138 [Actinia tenebrosa]